MTNFPQKQKMWNAKSLIKSRENRSLEKKILSGSLMISKTYALNDEDSRKKDEQN